MSFDQIPDTPETGDRMVGPDEGTDTLEKLARELLRAEGMSPADVDSVVRSCHSVLNVLYDALRPLVGNGGYETVLGRAAVMTARDYSRLGRLPIPRAGPPSAEELARALEGPDERPAAEVAETLVSELLAFLGRLLGWPLTLVVLRDLWPDVATGYDPADLEHSSRP